MDILFKFAAVIKMFKLLTIPHINSETNPLSPIINVICKYLRQCLATSFIVATLPTCCNIE